MDVLDSKYPSTIPIRHIDETRHSFPFGWLVLVIILAAAFIILFVFFIRQRSQLVESGQCPKVKGNYAVLPAVNGSIKIICGDGGDQACTLPALTLEQGINNCNFRSDICEGFSFDEVTGTMSILDLSQPLSIDTKTNIYIRQVGITPNQ